MLYMMLALLLSLHSAAGFVATGARPGVNMRASSAVSMDLSALEAVTQLTALVPQATAKTLSIGANAPNFGTPEAMASGAQAAYLCAALGIISVASRNGSSGLSPGTGGWDNNKDSSSTGGYASRTTPGGVEKVRFPPTMGGPERPAAGSGGNGILFAGVFPLILEISRAMQLPM